MASFTDTVSDFNPYIKTIPLESMRDVGIIKQQQFNQGVQKIQGAIDTIAGLDIAKDEVKEYVGSTLGKLKEGLSRNISGDFSDQRLVNQVGGAAKQIYSDPVIQNGVISTAIYKKGLSDKEEARKSGKWGVANEYNFDRKADEWLNDKQLGTSFSGRLTPYSDVRKKAFDIIKSVDKDSKLTQIPWVTDNNGRPVIDKNTGLPVWNDVMLETTTEGKSAKKIIEALSAGLDQNDIRQLEIEGEYEYSQSSPERMRVLTERNYQHKIDRINDKRNQLAFDLQGTENLNQQKVINQQIADLTEMGETEKKNYANSVQILSEDPEAYKRDFYIKNFLFGMGDALSSSKSDIKYLKSPYFDVFMDKENLRLRTNEYFIKVAEKNLKVKEFEYTQLKDAADRELELLKITAKGIKAKAGEEGSLVDAGIYSPTKAGDVEAPTEFIYREQILNTEKELELDKNEILQSSVFDNIRNLNLGNQQQAGLNYSYEKKKQAWEKGETKNMSPVLIAHFDRTRIIEQKALNARAAVDKVIKEADTKFGSIEGLKKQIPSVVPIEISFGSPERGSYAIPGPFDEKSKTYNLSQNDVVNFALLNTNGTIFDGKNSRRTAKEAKEELSRKFTGEQIGQIKATIKANSHYRKAEETINSETFNSRKAFIDQKLAELDKTSQTVTFGVNIGTKENESLVKTGIGTLLTNAKRTNKSNEAGSDFDYSDAVDALTDPNVTFRVKQIPDTRLRQGKLDIEIFSPKEGTTTSIRVDKKSAESLFNTRFDEVIYDINEALSLSGSRRTTNVQEKGAETALLNKTNFSSVKGYAVKGDVRESKNGGYELLMYIYDPKTKNWIQSSVPSLAPTGEVLNNRIREINDETIRRLTGIEPYIK